MLGSSKTLGASYIVISIDTVDEGDTHQAQPADHDDAGQENLAEKTSNISLEVTGAFEH
jgi:hypothetical protein